MKNKIYAMFVSIVFLAVCLSATVSANSPPSKPTITGQTNGKYGTEYTYTMVSTDPDGDSITYCVQWCSDCGGEVCLGPYSSGEEIKTAHSWDEEGTFTIKVKARDSNNAESDWATLTVQMPKYKFFNIAFFRLVERVNNIFPRLAVLLNL